MLCSFFGRKVPSQAVRAVHLLLLCFSGSQNSPHPPDRGSQDTTVLSFLWMTLSLVEWPEFPGVSCFLGLGKTPVFVYTHL